MLYYNTHSLAKHFLATQLITNLFFKLSFYNLCQALFIKLLQLHNLAILTCSSFPVVLYAFNP